MGFTIFYLSLIVLLPLVTVPIRAFSLGWERFWMVISDPRVVASYRITLGAAFVAACVNGVFGFLVAWVLVRYSFPGRQIMDALIDLPFALPTAVAGITLASLCAPNGWIGRPLASIGNAHVNAIAAQIARARESRAAETEHERARAGSHLRRRGGRVHRSFSVASPTSTRITVMIQKRTITLGSAQPLSS